MAAVTLPVNQTLTPAAGRLIAFDPAALADWPTALLPAGLPAPNTPATSATLTLTAVRPLTVTQSAAMQMVDEATATAEWPGAWSGAAGSIDPQPGIDYWRADNWDTSTGVYGWDNPYNSGAGSSYLNCGSGSPLWYGAAPFDVTFRLERSNWLALGDVSYPRMVARMWNPGSGGSRDAWRIDLTPRPPSAAANYVTFTVEGMGSVQASQTDIGAVDGVPIWIRCTRSGGTLTMLRSDDGTTWDTVASASVGGTPFDPGSYTMIVGSHGGYKTWNGRGCVDGILSEFTYRVNGSTVADMGMNDVPNTSATTWTATPPGVTVTRYGGTLLGGATGTIYPVFTFSAASALSDFLLEVSAISGEVLLEEILLEWEAAASRQIGLGRGVRGLG